MSSRGCQRRNRATAETMRQETRYSVVLFVVLWAATAKAAPSGPTGIWLAEGQPSMPWTAVLKTVGSAITGTVSHVDSGPIEIFEGRFERNIVSFKCKSPDGSRTVVFIGRLHGDEINFRRTVKVPPGAPAGGNGIFGARGPLQFAMRRINRSAVFFSATDPRTDVEGRDRPVTNEDLRIVRRTTELLRNESRWNRVDDRECGDDEAANKRSLFCALQRATVEVLGFYDHRRAALQEVRFAIEDASPGVDFEHRLMNFNNTSAFNDIKRALAVAEERISHRIKTAK